MSQKIEEIISKLDSRLSYIPVSSTINETIESFESSYGKNSEYLSIEDRINIIIEIQKKGIIPELLHSRIKEERKKFELNSKNNGKKVASTIQEFIEIIQEKYKDLEKNSQTNHNYDIYSHHFKKHKEWPHISDIEFWTSCLKEKGLKDSPLLERIKSCKNDKDILEIDLSEYGLNNLNVIAISDDLSKNHIEYFKENNIQTIPFKKLKKLGMNKDLDKYDIIIVNKSKKDEIIENNEKNKKPVKKALLDYLEIDHGKRANDLLNIAKKAISRDKLKSAKTVLTKAIYLKEHFIDAHHYSGIVNYELGDNEEAIEHFKEVISKNPNYIEAYFHMAECFMKLDKYDSAQKTYQRVIDIIQNDQLSYVLDGIKFAKKEGLNCVDITQNIPCVLIPKKFAGPKKFYKLFKPNKEEIALDEKNVTQYFKNNEKKISIPSGIKVNFPSAIAFKLSKMNYSALNVYDFMQGERLSDLIKNSKKKVKKTAIENVVDITANMHNIGKEISSEDIRTLKYNIKIGDEFMKLDFYTQRFNYKLLNVLEKNYNKKISDKDKKFLITRHKNIISSKLILAPDELYAIYTDANIRNFLFRSSSSKILAEPFSNRGSKDSISRIDLEKSSKRLGLIDVITAIEHEYVFKHNKTDNKNYSKKDAKYLARRWWATLRFKEKPEYKELIKALKNNDFYSFFQKHFNNDEIKNFENIRYFASAQRHATILGDTLKYYKNIEKVLDQYKTNPLIKSFEKNRNTKSYAICLTELDKKEKMIYNFEDLNHNEDLRNYITLKVMQEELNIRKQHHKTIFLNRLKAKGLHKYYKVMKKYLKGV